MKDRFVTDTMALVLRLEKRKAPLKVKDIFSKAEADEIDLFIPSMVLAEIGYLSEKDRIDTNIESALSYAAYLNNVSIDPLTEQIIRAAFAIQDIPELHDRIIAASASFRNAPLITNDPVIMKSQSLQTMW